MPEEDVRMVAQCNEQPIKRSGAVGWMELQDVVPGCDQEPPMAVRRRKRGGGRRTAMGPLVGRMLVDYGCSPLVPV